MRFLTEISDPFSAAELVARLNEAGCAASLEERPADMAIGGPVGRTFVYISEDADVEVAFEVLQGFKADSSISRGASCMGCGYDLRGHSGEGHCPECGRGFLRRDGAPVSGPDGDIICPSCGEGVPETFECCWNCGSDLITES